MEGSKKIKSVIIVFDDGTINNMPNYGNIKSLQTFERDDEFMHPQFLGGTTTFRSHTTCEKTFSLITSTKSLDGVDLNEINKCL